MKAQWFYSFLLACLIGAVTIAMVLVSIRAEESIFDLLEETRQAQAEQESTQFAEFIGGRVVLLTELVRRPLLANAVMGTTNSFANLDDYMMDFTLLGTKEPIYLVDIFGDTVASYHAELEVYPYAIQPWLAAVIDEGETSAVMLEEYRGHRVLVIAVPILYAGLPEGAVVAIVSRSAESILHHNELSDGVAVTVSSPYFRYTTSDDLTEYVPVISKDIEGTGVQLEYLVSQMSINEQKNGFLFDLGIGIAMSLVVSFVVLGIIGRQFFLNPYRRLEQSQHEIVEARNEAIAAAQAKSEFLANMSHEIRTPMNGVLGMLNLTLRSSAYPKQERQRLEIAHESASSLLSLINDILDFSKIEAGELSLEQRPFDLPKLLSGVVQALAYHAQHKNLQLVLDTTELKAQTVEGDETRLRQILANLISNAIKFTTEGEVVVRVVSDLDDADTPVTRFIVEDSGIGITPDQLEKIFESFKQADTSTTREFGGTGLGLSIVKQLSELMGGSISASSTPGEGSEFEVVLPLEVTQVVEAKSLNSSDGRQTVLVIDSHATLRDILGQQLESWQLQVVFADDIGEAQKVCRDIGHPDYVVMEVNARDDQRLKICEWLKPAIESEQTRIITTSNIDLDMDQAFLDAMGIHADITRPVSQSDLFDALTLQPLDAVAGEAAMLISEESRILLVEDNLINQEVALGILEGLGLTAECADTGAEAIDKLNSHQDEAFDLVLMDCQMPEMDGYEATRAIRSGRAGDNYKGVPIVAMTANAMSGDKEKCLAAGMDDYLSKPIDHDLLLEKLHRYLGSNEAIAN